MVDLYSERIYNCICGKNSPQGQNLYESIICTKCSTRSHQGCYDQFKDQFICLGCRLKLWGPFHVEVEKLVRGYYLYSNTRTEHQIPFKLTREQSQRILSGELQMVMMCSVLKTSNIYEWPQKNMIITIKNSDSELRKKPFSKEAQNEADSDTVTLNYDIRDFIYLDSPIISKILRPGNKTINITCTEPVKLNSYLFLSLMSEKSVKDVARDVLCSNFQEAEVSKGFYFNKTFEKEGLVIEKQEVPLIDVLSQQVMVIPIRGTNCKHLQCFDLLNHLSFNKSLTGPRKWSCPICRSLVTINEIFVDTYLHTILKEIKAKMKLGPKGEAHQCVRSITFDSNGDYHIQSRDPSANTSTNFHEKERMQIEYQPTFPPIIDIKVEKSDNANYKSATLVVDSPKSSATSLARSLEVNLDIFKTLSDQYKTSYGASKFIKIAQKLRELNAFHNKKPGYFYKFLQMTEKISFYENSKEKEEFHLFYDYPKTKRNELAELTVSELCEKLYKESSCGNIVILSIAWAKSVKDVIELIRLIAWKYVPTRHFEVYIEFILAYAFAFFNKEFPFSINIGSYSPSIMVIMAFLFKELGTQCVFRELEYGVLFSCFRDCLPDLFFPDYIEIKNSSQIYDSLTDFHLIILRDFETVETLVDMLQKLFKPPQIGDLQPEEHFAAKHFIYYFVTLLRKKEKHIALKDQDILRLIKIWDKYGVMGKFLEETKLDFMNIQINSIEPPHLYRKF